VDGLTWIVDLLGAVGNVPALTTVQPNTVAISGTSFALTVQDDWVQGVTPTGYTILGLTQGIEHFVRVAANSEPTCSRQSAFTSLVSSIPMQASGRTWPRCTVAGRLQPVEWRALHTLWAWPLAALPSVGCVLSDSPANTSPLTHTRTRWSPCPPSVVSYLIHPFHTRSSPHVSPLQVPAVPRDFTVGTALRVHEVQQVTLAAKNVEEVQVVTVTASVVPQVQTIRTSQASAGVAIAAGSKFTLTVPGFGGTPAALDYDSTEGVVKAEVDRQLNGAATTIVVRTLSSDLGGYVWSITLGATVTVGFAARGVVVDGGAGAGGGCVCACVAGGFRGPWRGC
jgi:hypothetical protein